jgi:hypothetical protein
MMVLSRHKNSKNNKTYMGNAMQLPKKGTNKYKAEPEALSPQYV